MSPVRRRPRLAVPAAMVAAGAVAAAAAAPAQAAGTTSAVCTNRLPAAVTPGFTPTLSAGTITTFGQTGSIACVGRIEGRRVTGLGSAGIHAYTQGSCTSHLGAGTVSVSIPTTGGVKHLTGALSVRRTALAIRAEARFPGGRFDGVGVVIPTRGTCFVTPLTRGTVVVTGVLSGT